MKVYEYTVKKEMIISRPPVYICHEISPQTVMESNEK